MELRDIDLTKRDSDNAMSLLCTKLKIRAIRGK